MSSPRVSQTECLKAEGNALFVKKNFKGAYKKYTEALKHDEKNPILYSNRAACSLGLNRYAYVSMRVQVRGLIKAHKRYLDASADATKVIIFACTRETSSRRLIQTAGYENRPCIRKSMGTPGISKNGLSIALT
jgi:hypothetical protein